MSSGTSKRIKRQIATISIAGKKQSGPVMLNFTGGTFNNTQLFNHKQQTRQAYEAEIELQKNLLIQARDNADFLSSEVQRFNKIAEEWITNLDKSGADVANILNQINQYWLTQHNISETSFLKLVFLFEATYQVGNSQSIKKSSTAQSWQKWWKKYGLSVNPDGSIVQTVFQDADPADINTLYWIANMQKELAAKILSNACRVNLRDKQSSPQKADLSLILKTDILRTYGAGPVRPSPSPATMVRQNMNDFRQGLKFLLLFWRKCLANLGDRGIQNKTINYINLPIDKDVIKTDTFYVGLDCEYVSRLLPEDVKQNRKITKVRNVDDVLSFQLYAINAKGTKRNGMVVHNTTHQHFTMSELISAIQRVIEPLRMANVQDHSKRRATVHLFTYYGGVDLSCFAGWERFWNGTNMVVLKKNAPFSLGSVRKKLCDGSYMSIDVLDMMNDAPVGGLAIVGDMVGIPKIDTTTFDKADGKTVNYYKEHMDIFRKNRPNDFNSYAMNDAIITLEYGLFLKRHLGKIPRTIGSYAASEVSKQRQEFPEQFISDPDYPLRAYVKSKGAERIRPGQADLYEEARKALYGGHNCAYVSGWGYGRILDFDLASAYNIGGHLLPIIDYSDDSYPIISPDALPDHMKRTHFNSEVTNSFRIKDCDFAPIGQQLQKTSIFLIGVGKFKVDYPDDAKFIVTPSHSDTGATTKSKKDKELSTGSPCYVKHYTDWAPLIDAYTAWIHGASVHVISLRVPKQCQDGLNIFGDFQNRSIKLRNASKAKMKHSKKGSSQWAQAYGEQLLYKLIANSLFGKTLQGAGNHNSRDFDTNLMGETPKSAVTDPLIGDSYTGFTRYLVSILYDASNHCSKPALQLNITTDGLSLVISPKDGADSFIDEMTKYFNAQMEDFYFDRLSLAGKKRGFELKANVEDYWFNLRTRVNGTRSFSQTGSGIFATASMIGQQSNDLFKWVHDNVIFIKNKSWRLSNLTEMKFRLQNHYGSQEQVEQVTNVSLGYDFSYKPVQLIQDSNNCYFTTLPFDNKEEHDQVKELGGKLVKMVPMRTNTSNFNLFMRTLVEQPVIKRSLYTLKDRDKYLDEYRKYCHQHYIYDLALGVLQGDLNREINRFCSMYGTSVASLKKGIRRVKAKQSKVNFVAGWYFKEVLKNG